MRRLATILALGATLLFVAGLQPGRGAEASNTAAAPRPILECADVDGNGPVSVGDIGTIVGKFGRGTGQAGFHPIFEVGAVDGTISVGDIGGVVADFGLSCSMGKPDTQIARATLWSLGLPVPDIMGQSDCDMPANPAPPLTENTAALGAIGYYKGSFDVPGQGIHYVKDANWEDSTFDPCRPEGLVYLNAGGPLSAMLYVTNGDSVGWGGYGPPGPVNQIDIDTFCSPAPCSWTGPASATYGDGFHIHFDLCTTHIGMGDASALPGVPDGNCPDEDDSACTNPAVPDCNRWDNMTGWMGHLWNHIPNPNNNTHDVNNNGRFADCLPDGFGWKAFNCPQ